MWFVTIASQKRWNKQSFWNDCLFRYFILYGLSGFYALAAATAIPVDLAQDLENRIIQLDREIPGLKLTSKYTCDIFGPNPSHMEGQYECTATDKRWACTLFRKDGGVMQLSRIVAFNGTLYQSYNSKDDHLSISTQDVFPFMWYGQTDVSPLSIMGFLLYRNKNGAEDYLYAPHLNDIFDRNVWSDFLAGAIVVKKDHDLSFQIATAPNKLSNNA